MKSYRRHTAEGADGSGNNGGRKGDRKSSKRTGGTSGRGKAKTTSSSGDDEYNTEDDPNYVGVPRRRHEDNYMRLERETDNLARRLMLQRSAEHERGPDSRQYPPDGAYVHANGGNGLRYPSANTHLAHTSQLQITEGHHADYGRYPYHANANSHGFPAYDYSAPYHGIEGVRSDGNVYDPDYTYQEYRQREQCEQREQEDDLGENGSGGWCHIRSDASHY